MGVQAFVYEHPKFGKLRGLVMNGDSFFVGKDVAIALGYKDADKALRDHVPAKFKRVITAKDFKQMASNQEPAKMADSQMASNQASNQASNEMGNFFSENGMGGVQRLTFINEAGLYKLILRSKLPAAEEFSDWICEEVLPAIRKYGYYSLVPETAPAPVVTKAAKNPKRVIGQTKPACCYIALMVNETKTFAVVKVGQSYEVEVRLSKIAQKYKLRVDKHYKTLLLPRKISLAVERACKELLAPFKVEGEFFAVDYDTAYKIITTVEGLIADLSKRDTFEDDNALESAESLRLESSNLIADKNLSTDFVGDIFLPE